MLGSAAAATGRVRRTKRASRAADSPAAAEATTGNGQGDRRAGHETATRPERPTGQQTDHLRE
ncbi:hypothetical protein C8039_17430 [Halogeometricum sp. wsp3]|nr:hypothetical protein C8039_17430 [Halogeometricum sp. wsp3]